MPTWGRFSPTYFAFAPTMRRFSPTSFVLDPTGNQFSPTDIALVPTGSRFRLTEIALAQQGGRFSPTAIALARQRKGWGDFWGFISSQFHKIIFQFYVEVNFSFQCFKHFKNGINCCTVGAAFEFRDLCFLNAY